MPVSNGRIYRDTSSTPTKGVSLDDIGECLEMPSRDLGTLCQGMEDYETAHVDNDNDNPLFKRSNQYHGQIKAWSKNKPIWFQGVFPSPSDSSYASKRETIMKGSGDGYDTDDRKNGWATNNNTGTAAFKTVYGIEVPTGVALYGSASGSGSFIGSGAGAGDPRIRTQFSTNAEGVLSSGGWLCGLIMDGHTLVQTKVVTMRWRYEPPLADAMRFNELFFDDYDHNSVNPMPRIGDDNSVYLNYDNSDNTINFVITAEKPVVNERNISLSELNSAIKSGWTNPAGNAVPPIIKVGNVAKGIEDMYLCAVVYHTHWDGNAEDSVVVDFALWGSASVPYGNGTATGCNTVVFKIPNYDAQKGGADIPPYGCGASTVKEFFDKMVEKDNVNFLYGQGNDGTNGNKEWRVKFFWCTTNFERVNGDLNDSDYVLLRGNDDYPAGQVIVLKDINDVGNQPYVEIKDGHTIFDDGEGYLSYLFEFVLHNPTDTIITNQLLLVNMYFGNGNGGINTTQPITQSTNTNSFTVSKEQSREFSFSLPNILDTDDVVQFLVYFKYRKAGDSTDRVCGAFLSIITVGTSRFFDIQYIGEASAERYKDWSDYATNYTPLIGS